MKQQFLVVPSEIITDGVYFEDFGETYEADDITEIFGKIADWVRFEKDEYEQFSEDSMKIDMPNGTITVEARFSYGWEIFTKINT